MSARHPSRLALAVLGRFVAGDDPLTGDLIEEFHQGRSRSWLWRQVLWAVVHRSGAPRVHRGSEVARGLLAVAMLVLMAFEVVLVTNAVHRFVLGPPLQDIRGHAYTMPPLFTPLPAQPPPPVSSGTWALSVVAIMCSLPLGWFIARIRERRRMLALGAFSISITLCAGTNLGLPIPAQVATSVVFIVGLLVAGTIEATIDAQPSR
jgi:hypothetical protein